MAPIDAVHHRAGLAGPVRADRRRTRRSRCTWPPGRAVDGALVDDELSARRWRWPAGWSSSAGRPAPRPRCATRQPLRRALVGLAAWTGSTDELRARGRRGAQRAARSSRCRAAGADLVDFTAKGNFRALGKRFGKQTPLVAAAIAAADAAALAADARGRRPGDRRRRRRGRRGARPTR